MQDTQGRFSAMNTRWAMELDNREKPGLARFLDSD
jgi:hypothetical protein